MNDSKQAMAGAATTPQGAISDEKSSGNAILVDGKLLSSVRAWLTSQCNVIDEPCSRREMIDAIVHQVGPILKQTPFYYVGDVDGSNAYKWFGSDMARYVSGSDDLRDKGRWVDACLILYRYGQNGLKKWCRPSIKRYPPKLTQEQMSRIAEQLTAMSAPEVGEFEVEPTSCPVE